MIGQKENITMINSMIDEDRLPRFIIIEGEIGSGRYELAKYISNKLNAQQIDCDLTIDSVREVLNSAYSCHLPTTYIFRDVDNKSFNAKVALLKVTEEPPKQAYFIFTAVSNHLLPDPIRSRSTKIKMQPYTNEELKQFLQTVAESNDSTNETILNIATCPGDIIRFSKIDMHSLLQFCVNITSHIKTVSGVNAFKLPKYLKLKDDSDGYELDLFFKCLIYQLRQLTEYEFNQGNNKACAMYFSMILESARCAEQLKMNGAKKDSIIDMWILNMREC